MSGFGGGSRAPEAAPAWAEVGLGRPLTAGGEKGAGRGAKPQKMGFKLMQGD